MTLSSVTPNDQPVTRKQRIPVARRVLLVDDNGLARRHVTRLLEAAGHAVTCAGNGEEAFILASNEHYDVVVTDVSMGTVSGIHLCRMLRAQPRTEDLPIVLLTADDGPRSRFWGRHAGADAHLGKTRIDELHDTIARIVPETPREPRPSAGEVDPIAHLCGVLDRELSHAVIASEGRALLEHLDDDERFVAECANLMASVLDCAFTALVSADGTRSVVVAREPLSRGMDGGVPGLGLTRPPVHVAALHEPGGAPPELDPARVHRVPILAGRKLCGELRLHGAGKRVARRDLESAAWVAEALAGPVEAMRLVQHVQRLATEDSLTGLLNRRAMRERLTEEVRRAGRYRVSVAVILGDIDHFKQVNDTFGHGMGDEVLKLVAQTLQDSVRNVDSVARWGGEEFLVVLPHQEVGGAAIVAERLRHAIDALPPFEQGPAGVSMSLGVAVFDGDTDADALIARADEALYAAKRAGRNRIEIAPRRPRD